MSDFVDMIKPDAFVGLSYEFEYDGILQGPSAVSASGPVDFGEDPWPFGSIYIEAVDSGGFVSPDVKKTILTFTNLGHVLPMDWTITRTLWNDLTNTISGTTTQTFTLVTTNSFTCEPGGPNTHAEFTATFKSPA
jgi:hypothetical protein